MTIGFGGARRPKLVKITPSQKITTIRNGSAAARELAAKGINEPGQDEKFMPFGVFTLAPENQTEATAMLQLAVSKQGVLRGTYDDLLSDVDHPIRGSVDRTTQHVAWTFGDGKVAFQTALGVLTEPLRPCFGPL
jgi:hypothetical protein